MDNELTFEPFPKLARLNRECVITEKIDGTNAQLVFSATGALLVGSRKRQIHPEGTREKGSDNFGFAGWAYENRALLFDFLGEGRHYGEWAGGRIQRGYGLEQKRFFLFATHRFPSESIPPELKGAGLDAVPLLYEGPFCSETVDTEMENLRRHSRVNDYHNPEGVVVYHTALKRSFKVTFEHDHTGKGENR